MCEKCAKVDEMIGQTFGKLTVLERVENSSSRQKRYLCKCDCGNIVKILGSSLRKGISKSCGCLTKLERKYKEEEKDKKYINKKFGLWTVLKRVENSKNGDKRFLCRCECGTEKPVLLRSLIKNLSTSCGCANILDLTGKKFGMLTVIKMAGRNKYHNSIWECKCDCGNTTQVLGTNLIRNKTTSCGCNQYTKAKEKFVDISGKKFNRLTVLRRIKNPGNTYINYNYLWLCKCDCGNEVMLPTGHIVSGNNKSCGCFSNERQDITGKKFNHLTAIKKVKVSNKKGTSWLFKCDCGNEVILNKGNVVHGKTTSCGCGFYTIEDLTGQKFNKLTVISLTDQRGSDGRLWKCKCDCGNITYATRHALLRDHVKSCGCIGSSYGEDEISAFLKSNFIDYTKEITIKESITSRGGYPRFDFQILNRNGHSFFLEYHGEQHYWELKHDPEFGKQQREETDLMKIKYCEDNNITFHTIGFFEDTISSLSIILYFHELLSPEKERRNRIVYKLKQTLFEDKDGHLSIFSPEEEFEAAA